MSTATAEVIVVGLGAMGSATLYQLARRGVRPLGLDRFAPPHDRGSSHGESRITRQAVGEGEAYVPFVLRSHEIWRELTAETGGTLMSTNGGLIIGREAAGVRHHGQANFVQRTIDVARRFGIPHEVLDAAEVPRRFPPFRLVGDELCYYEPGAGLLHPDRCVATQLYRARAHGAVMRTGETVLGIAPSATDVRVATDRATYTAGRVVVTAGAWLPRLLGGPFPALLGVYRQTLHWFAVDDAARFAPGRFPVFIWIHGSGAADYFYGLPLVADGVKLGAEQFAEPTDPDRIDRAVTAAETRTMYETHVSGRLAGVRARCTRAETCLYTVTPDAGFIVDDHPDTDRVLVVSPCSGHGFKHSAALGEAVAERVVTGKSRLDLAPFGLARFGHTARGPTA